MGFNEWIGSARARLDGVLQLAGALSEIAAERLAPPREFELAGKVVVISGGAGGIGRALAAAFGQVGAKIGLLDIDASHLEAAAEALRASGIEVETRACDICDEAATRAAIAAIGERFGGLDVMINNAGITHLSLLQSTDTAVVRRVMAVNFFGSLHCTHAALPSIRERRGTIVAISSVAGIAPLIGRTGYCASKHALHGFFDTLRNELHGTGVDVLLVCPSFVDTAIDRNALDVDGRPVERTARNLDSGKIRASRTALGQMATPEQLAEQILTAVRRRERLLLPTSVARSAFWVSRFAPRIYDHLMRASQRALFDR